MADLRWRYCNGGKDVSRPPSPAIHDLNGACGSKDRLVDRYIGTITVDGERYCCRCTQHNIPDTVSVEHIKLTILSIIVVFSSLFYTYTISTRQMIYRHYDRDVGRPLMHYTSYMANV